MGNETLISHKKPSKDEIKKQLTPLQYEVTQENATEPPFENEYWNEHREGIYVDIVSGEPLFSSKAKFDSGCGWPSFFDTVKEDNVKEKTDTSHGMTQDRGPEQKSRFASGTFIRRRARADRTAVLHKLGSAAFHPEGRPGKGRIRGI